MVEPIVEEINLSKLSLLELEGLRWHLDSLVFGEQLRRYQAQEFKVGDVVVKRIEDLSHERIGQAKIVEIRRYTFTDEVTYILEGIKEDQYGLYPPLEGTWNQGAFNSSFMKAELVEEEILEHGLNIAYKSGGPLNHEHEGGRFPPLIIGFIKQ